MSPGCDLLAIICHLRILGKLAPGRRAGRAGRGRQGAHTGEGHGGPKVSLLLLPHGY